jgi:hypothetical protein
MPSVTANRTQARSSAGLLSDGAALTFGVLILSALTFGLTSHRCSGDGSFDVFGPDVGRSTYCKAAHFPRFPASVPSVLLDALLFVLPTLVVLLGTVASVRASSSRPLWRAGFLGGAMLSLSLLLIPLAHVRYLGAP